MKFKKKAPKLNKADQIEAILKERADGLFERVPRSGKIDTKFKELAKEIDKL